MAESQTRQVKKLDTRIKLKRDLEANWKSNNPVILNGEVIFVTMADGSVKAKVGDGVKKYNELPFSDKALQDSISSLDAKVENVDDRVDTVNNRVGTAFEQISELNTDFDDFIKETLPSYTNQHAFSKIKVSATEIAADAATDTLTITSGSNISITPNATGDEIEFSVKTGTTAQKGVVQLTDGVNSTSTTTAATPNSVKQAYDKASLAIEQISATDQNLANLINKTLPDYTNQHAFSHVVVDSTNIAADSATDTITIAAGDNITITPDTANDKITFSVADGSTTAKGVVQLTDSVNSTSTTTAATPKNVKQAYDLASVAKEDAAAALAEANRKYTHPINSGNKHIPSGGSSGQILRWSADGTATWGADNNTTYGVVSTTADGLAPKRDGSTAKFLRADGTWAVPPDTNTDTNTTYTIATGDSNGQIKVTPSSGAAYNVSVKGLGTAAYKNHTDYAASSHTHSDYAASSHTHSGYAGTNHNQASNTINAMTGYSKPSTTGAISTLDSLNAAIGKLEKALDSKGTSNLTLGTTSATAAAGNHTHDGRYYTEAEINNKLNGKSNTDHTHDYAATGHNHDDIYYTETEVDNLLKGKAASSHGNHVPATQTANNAKFLRNDNTWQTVTPANIGALGVNDTAVKADTAVTADTADRLPTNWVYGSVLDFALSCPLGLTNIVTSGADTTDLPTWSNNYGYCTGLVMKRTDAFVYVELHPYNVKYNPIARNSYSNGDWCGWTYDYSEANKPPVTAANFVVPTSLIYTSADNLPSSGTAGQLYFVKRSVQG